MNSNTQNKPTRIKPVIIIIVLIIIVVFIISSCSKSDGPVGTIQWDVRQNQSILGYGTKYTIGEVQSVSCSEEENDGNGRYIVKCNLSYYPKRMNGTIATDSKMNETVYAIYMRTNGSEFLRQYTSYPTNSFKQERCWGKDKSKGLSCR